MSDLTPKETYWARLVGFVLGVLIGGVVFAALWNLTCVPLFDGRRMEFWQAWALFAMVWVAKSLLTYRIDLD